MTELRVTDIQIHVQPWRQLRPAVLAAMRRDKPDFDRLMAIVDDPGELLAYLDRCGIWRAGLARAGGTLAAVAADASETRDDRDLAALAEAIARSVETGGTPR